MAGKLFKMENTKLSAYGDTIERDSYSFKPSLFEIYSLKFSIAS